jgi:hypothetical protein
MQLEETHQRLTSMIDQSFKDISIDYNSKIEKRFIIYNSIIKKSYKSRAYAKQTNYQFGFT